MKIRDASVTVRPTWVTIEDMDFPRLAKLSLPGIKEGNISIMFQVSLKKHGSFFDFFL